MVKSKICLGDVNKQNTVYSGKVLKNNAPMPVMLKKAPTIHSMKDIVKT